MNRMACLSLLCVMFLAVAASGNPGVTDPVRESERLLIAIGSRLSTANATLCDRLQADFGFQLHSLDQYPRADRADIARRLGMTGNVAISAIVPGGPADRAGLREGDVIQSIGPVVAPEVTDGPPTAAALVTFMDSIASLPKDAPLTAVVDRRNMTMKVRIAPDAACHTRYELVLDGGKIARADGSVVQIGHDLLACLSPDMAAVPIAHELAHNILNHRARLRSRGVAFGIASGFGRNVRYFRQTELEADILSAHLLHRAGFDADSTPAFWARLGGGTGLFQGRTHPALSDRLRSMAAEWRRIDAEGKQATLPDFYRHRTDPLSGNWQALIVR